MHPPDCPPFEYKDHPQRHAAITAGQKIALQRLSGPSSLDLLADTRPLHSEIFRDLCPPDHDYFAGHYRGEDFYCLKFCRVGIKEDPRVGYAPEHVLSTMGAFARLIRSEIEATDSLFALPDSLLPAGAKLTKAVASACRIFVDFLTIHPYVNGNGHIARLLLTAMLRRYGLRLLGFPIEPRPGPPYLDLIRHYRNGQTEPFERFILGRLA